MRLVELRPVSLSQYELQLLICFQELAQHHISLPSKVRGGEGGRGGADDGGEGRMMAGRGGRMAGKGKVEGREGEGERRGGRW